MSERRRLDIVIVNWNSGSMLERCLDSVASVNDPSIVGDVTVVDNASDDGSADHLGPHGLLKIRRCRNASNLGFAKACNAGVRYGSADYVLFLNPDMRLESDSLAAPLAVMDKAENSSVGIVGIQLVNSAGAVWRSCARFPTAGSMAMRIFGLDAVAPRWFPSYPMVEWDHAHSRDVDHVIGAFFLVRRRLFESLGGFDERFFMYLEDLDFSLRARQAGWRSTFLADVRAQHVGGGTSAQVKTARLFYSLKSRLLYVRKHFAPLPAASLMAGTLLLEPVPRLVRALARANISEAGETVGAFAMLWRDLLTAKRSR